VRFQVVFESFYGLAIGLLFIGSNLMTLEDIFGLVLVWLCLGYSISIESLQNWPQ
jgi:hypothetical protein